MYPRNAASPERIAIGPVVQISDGAVQTSGVSVKVLPQGGAASGGGGTVAYEEGIVHYLPTQAETNHASFVLIAYKTGCIPAATTVVTSASATTGYAGLDWSKVSAPTTTLALSGTTISTAQKVDLETIKTQAVTASAGVTFPTSVASPTNITAGTITTVSGNVTGSVGSVAAGGITAASIATDAITATAIAADAIGASELAADAANEIADALLGRNVSGGSSTGRTVKQALHALRNKVTVSAGTMTVYDTDDASSSWTATVTSTPGADPITTVDPA